MDMRKSTAKSTPAVKLPAPEIEDRGLVRLGNTSLTAAFPPLKCPDPQIADPGIIRLGNTSLTGRFPV
jgi:hypothetical protein